MDNFDRCFSFTIGAEGGYSADLADPGNWTGGETGHGELRGTKFGISAAAYPNLDIASLTEVEAEEIYRRDYWAGLCGDALPLPIALVTFDAAVNAGQHQAIMWLQEAVGVKPDGTLGPLTLAALNSCDAMRIAREALVRRLDYSTRLTGWKNFGLGWSRRLIALASIAAASFN